jgi:hypothetical protein
LPEAEGDTSGGVSGKPSLDPAQSKTLYMRGNPLHGNREIPPTPAADGANGSAGEGLRPYVRHARRWEVG